MLRGSRPLYLRFVHVDPMQQEEPTVASSDGPVLLPSPRPSLGYGPTFASTLPDLIRTSLYIFNPGQRVGLRVNTLLGVSFSGPGDFEPAPDPAPSADDLEPDSYADRPAFEHLEPPSDIYRRLRTGRIERHQWGFNIHVKRNHEPPTEEDAGFNLSKVILEPFKASFDIVKKTWTPSARPQKIRRSLILNPWSSDPDLIVNVHDSDVLPDPQGFKFKDVTLRNAIRLKRQQYLQQQLDQTRPFLRESAPLRSAIAIKRRHWMLQSDIWFARTVRRKDKGAPLFDYNFDESADISFWRKSGYFASSGRCWSWKLHHFHKENVAPCFDHFQLKTLTLLGESNHRDNVERPKIFYFQQFEGGKIGGKSSFWTPTACPAGRTAVYMYDVTTKESKRILGPWKLSISGTAAQEHSRVSFNSAVLYTIGISKNFVAVADGASSVLVCHRDLSSEAVDWGLGHRVADLSHHIINSLILIEGDEVAANGHWTDVKSQAEVVNDIRSQCRKKGSLKLLLTVNLLATSIEKVEITYLQRLTIHALKEYRPHDQSKAPSALTTTEGSEGSGSLPLRLGESSMIVGAGGFGLTIRSRWTTTLTTARSTERTRPSVHAAGSPLHDLALTEQDLTFVESSPVQLQPTIGPLTAQVQEAHSTTREAADLINEALKAAGSCFQAKWTQNQYRLIPTGSTIEGTSMLTVLTAGNDKCVSEYALNLVAQPAGEGSVSGGSKPFSRVMRTSNVSFGTVMNTLVDGTYAVVPMLSLTNRWKFPFCVNHVALHPAKDLLLMIGDDPNAVIISRRHSLQHEYLEKLGTASRCRWDTTKPLYVLEAHQDCGFAGDWHPGGQLFATGNDDETIAIWDLRKLMSPVRHFPTEGTACRSLKFSPDGKYMVSCESEDTAVIYGVDSNFETKQVVEFFGGCTGATFTNDSKTCLINVAAPKSQSGIMELSLQLG